LPVLPSIRRCRFGRMRISSYVRARGSFRTQMLIKTTMAAVEGASPYAMFCAQSAIPGRRKWRTHVSATSAEKLSHCGAAKYARKIVTSFATSAKKVGQNAPWISLSLGNCTVRPCSQDSESIPRALYRDSDVPEQILAETVPRRWISGGYLLGTIFLEALPR
jgi:hypothetical protein